MVLGPQALRDALLVLPQRAHNASWRNLVAQRLRVGDHARILRLVLAEVLPGVLVAPDAFADEAKVRLRLCPRACRASRSEVTVEACSSGQVQLRLLNPLGTRQLLLNQLVGAPTLRQDLKARYLSL